MRKFFAGVLIGTLFVFNMSLVAQDLESVGKGRSLTVPGGVSLNQIVYVAWDIDSWRDPYTYDASENVNFSLYGWSM